MTLQLRNTTMCSRDCGFISFFIMGLPVFRNHIRHMHVKCKIGISANQVPEVKTATWVHISGFFIVFLPKPKNMLVRLMRVSKLSFELNVSSNG